VPPCGAGKGVVGMSGCVALLVACSNQVLGRSSPEGLVQTAKLCTCRKLPLSSLFMRKTSATV
jgi:hypothetical protein